MVITDKRQKQNTIDFSELQYGEVFQDEDGDICIKMDNEYSFSNAVVLATGQAFNCKEDTPVTPLWVELIITNNK